MATQSPDQGTRGSRVLAHLGVAGAAGAAMVGLTWAFAPSPIPLLLGWLTASGTFLIWTWSIVARLDAEQTRTHAVREDPGHVARDLIIDIVATATLLIVVFILFSSQERTFWLLCLGLLGIISAWVMVHTVFMLRYARIFFTDPVGGVDFPDDSEQTYAEFAYLAFTVGMTFQVADTDLTSRPMRIAVLQHALLAFVFNTVVIAVTINILAGLGS